MQALSRLLNADPIGVHHHLLLLPPLHLLPLLAWHTKAIFVGGAQNQAIASVAIGYHLLPTPNRPITLDCPGHPATTCPQLGPFNGQLHVQVGESKIPPLGKLNGKKCHEAGVPYPHRGGLGNPRPPVDIKGIKKKAVPLLNGTALPTQGSGNPELLEGTKRKCDPSSSS